jgi:hypothetical protein
VLFPLLGIGSHVRCLHSRDNLGTTQFAQRCTRSKKQNDVWCKTNSWRCKLSFQRVRNLILRLVVPEVACGSARWRLGRFGFVNKQNSQVEPRNRRNSTIYIPSSRLHLLSLFLPYYTHRQDPDLDITWLEQNNATHSKTHPITYTTLYFPTLSIRASVHYMQLCHNANVSDVDLFSTQSDGTKGQQRRKEEG